MWQIGHFVRVDGNIGVVVANELSGGVWRGHIGVWFGRHDSEGNPIVTEILAAHNKSLKWVPTPIPTE